MATKLGYTIRYTTHHPEAKKHARSTLRRNMGAELYANLQLFGLGNMFTIKIEEETYPTRVMGQEVNKFSGYDRIPPEMVDEEEFRITARVEITNVVPVVYQFKPEIWDYSLRKSSMPEWLKGILRWIWREND